MNMHVKKVGTRCSVSLLVVGFIFLLQSICLGSEIEIFKKGSYALSLESKSVSASSSIVEYFDIDSLGNKIPDQLFITVQSGDWISSLPCNVFVSDQSNNVDKITEYWEVNFAKTKKGRIVFSRTIINNSDTDKDSYAWDLNIKCKFVKYR